jgi:hypothetical protein
LVSLLGAGQGADAKPTDDLARDIAVWPVPAGTPINDTPMTVNTG